ncbi:MAG TPA: aminotransferase class I/II-fold pyridoxal phosphate-dependent enzyme [Acidimicrobiia bacterium]|nr:aminotransferase class I/II-fold pyridoxal phosphate-dependent enzyme [Acidimicrobiia bacterium]
MRLHRRNADKSASAGLTGVRFSDVGDGSAITIEGREVSNFGSCSYLGLAVDERLKRGAIEAVERFGPLFSSSQVYAAVDLYTELEEGLGAMTDAPAVVVPPTTTLGHLACLPTLVGEGDVVVLDSHSHASLQLSMQVLAGRQIEVHPVPHDEQEALADKVSALASSHRRVWYVGDGVYSMFGDLAPLDLITDLMATHDNLYAYHDDAHGFSWLGLHGRGYVLSQISLDERTVVAAGLAKSFGSGGAALFFGDPEMAAAVRHLGGPMTFSGPIHPPTLGAAVAATRVHLSEEHIELRFRILDQVRLVAGLLAEHRLPVVSWAATPIWLVRIGDFDRVLEIAGRMLDDGFYLNVSAFPAVPMGMAGLRFTHTLSNSTSQITTMIERLSHHVSDVVGEMDVEIDLAEMERSAGLAEPATDLRSSA